MECHATVPTPHASRYLQTLCKHFGHKVAVEFDATAGRITLPFGACALRADEAALEMSVEAGDDAALRKAAQVIASHLERFAFRENPTITWRDAR